MHRSGTSALTRILNLLGFPLCVPDDLYSEWDNPHGHWESQTVIDVNDALLRQFRGNWFRPPMLGAGWENDTAVRALASEASVRFAEVHPTDDWVVKDPRMCLTFPFWRNIIQPTAIVLATRAPAPVALSILRRDHLRPRIGLGLWERYTRAALEACAGFPTVVVHHEEILRDPRVGITKLARSLAEIGIEVGADHGAAVASIDGAVRSKSVPQIRLTNAQKWLLTLVENLQPAYAAFPALSLGRPTPLLERTIRLPGLITYRA
jgi:hypothetical protein